MAFWHKLKFSAQSSAQVVDNANRIAAVGQQKALAQLRRLPVEAFGDLLLSSCATAPALSKVLPSMASDEAQQLWTGCSGAALMAQSLDFMRSVDQACHKHLGHGIRGKVLDYGCGWGRLLRLLLWYVDPEQIYGADPWDQSIATCRQHHCPGHLALCDYLPTSLPFAQQFNLIYAFSVFTHLPETTADAILKVLHRHIEAKGMLVITIRPPEYWNFHRNWLEGYTKDLMLERHQQTGFAFMPHALDPSDDFSYGDTSMTVDFIRQRWPQWKVVDTVHNASDPLQILVFMQPV
ncbi:MAG: class I SAM-dependent methyltransferase [Pseudomonadales bacterium]|jgi:ubiquinone/menaquinone biosynthesis C-methylase UbiE|nr:class I SAM-dependent methyltransferase [Pseudomonadales bacterium]